MRLAYVAGMAMLVAGCGSSSPGGDMAMSLGDMAMSAGDMATFGPAPCPNATDYMAATTIAFGGALGTTYSPKCITVAAGGSVTWNGDFSFHPLNPSTRGSTGNPIMLSSAGTSAMFTFPTAGFFPFFCGNHGSNAGTGMAGVVQVQ